MRLATYETADGETVTIQVSDDGDVDPALVTRGWSGGGTAVQKPEQALDDALSRVQPAIRALISQLQAYTDVADEFQVEFGIQLSVGVGAFISASSTSNFRVLMTLRPRAVIVPLD